MWGRQHEKERSRVADINQLRQSELAILEALTEPLTDAEIAQRLNRSRQVVCVARRALHRAGLIASFGTRPVAPGVRPAIVWKLA
jgi:DNA-binding NarL/FixJ family response regulator